MYNISTQKLINLIKLCRDNYDEKTFNHAVRVANYAVENVMSQQIDKDTLYCLALCHDLLEDTTVTCEDINKCINMGLGFIKEVLESLTKNKEEDYIDYIQRLKKENNFFAYIIKLADMKDHLMQTETLTDKLKEKYWKALPYLL